MWKVGERSQTGPQSAHGELFYLRHLFNIIPNGDKRTWSLYTGINQSLEMQNFSKMRPDLGRGICLQSRYSPKRMIELMSLF